MNMRYSKIYALLLAAMVTAGVAMTQDAAAQTSTGVTIKGSVYGGGNAADVKVNTVVNIGGGNVQGNVYGGGKIGDVGTHAQIPGDNIGNYTWTDNTGVCNVNIISGTIGPNGDTASDDDHGNVFGGGKGVNTTFWCEKAMVYSTNVTINNGTVKGSVFGGGEVGRVETDAVVKIGDGEGVAPGGTATSAPQIKGSVFGAGKGLKTHGYSALVRGNVTLTIEGNAKIFESVYGGGELASVGKHKVKTSNDPLTPTDAPADLPVGMPYTLDGTNVGECTVNVQGYAEITNNVFGAGQGVGAADYNYDSSFQRMGMNGWEGLSEEDYSTFLQTLALTTDTDVNIGGNAKVKKSVYGGSENGFVQYDTDVSIQGSCEIGTSGTTTYGNVFGGGKGLAEFAEAGNVKGNTEVAISGGTAYGNVYGGGERGVVKENVTVNVTGGTVTNDVYGGGALADTNTANWNPTGGTGGTGDWADATNKSALHTTTVNLTGGTIGNGYGGGLGNATTPASVWGDVTVTVNGTAFTIANDSYTEESKTIYVPKSGRVFGCNNINGSPKGDVTVRVKKTVAGNVTRTANTDLDSEDETKHTYEIAAVYGGGNEAPYEPVKVETESTTDENFDNDDTKASTNVIIEGCADTSIETVYGGGNAASTPSTKVTIQGAYEIGEVFGGGNGKDKIKHGDSWDDNEGAHVGFRAYAKDATPEQKTNAKYGSGQARVNIYGGKIHAVYGGSNTLGNVRRVAVAMLDQLSTEDCAIAVDEAYGGGKSANMDGKAILNLGCIPGLTNVYGGARAATVNNDVVLNITNGTYTNVFGGNNESGAINGSITVNVEETGCRPIHITNLYGGGNRAAYPGTGATVADANKKITVNVKSCTSIGNVFGGGLGNTAIVTGTTEVNINQIKGKFSKTSTGYTQNIYGDEEVEGLGTIGNVYGGGSEGKVVGNTYVNIGTKATVKYETGTDTTTDNNVLGVNITGSVYGGGLSANVEGSSTVKIGTVELTDQNATGVKIAKDVFGGGEGSTTNVSGDVTVEIGKDNGDNTFTGDAYIGTDTYAGSVYGGSAYGSVNTQAVPASGSNPATAASGEVTVKLHKGNVKGAVYGGGMGKEPTGASTNDGIEAKVFGNSEVTLYGDVVTGGLFGGCNLNGRMFGTATLNLFGGTVGTAYGENPTIPDKVFGGGFGSLTTVDGKIEVNVGTEAKPGTCTIYGNVYGGSMSGSTNAIDVNLYGGTIYGNVFGGGYQTADGKTAATDVNVKLDGTTFASLYNGTGVNAVPLTGQIFGCNNLQGSPTGSVEVHVYKTEPREGQAATEYDLQAVYGGGNLAPYKPADALLTNNETNKDKIEAAHTNVIIEGCGVSSIKEVYGGGNAAPVPATEVQIIGAKKIFNVFGGGNGSSSAADVGILDATAYAANKQNGIYGSGKALTKLFGGTITNVYGGSNTTGNVRGDASVEKKTSNDCPLQVDNIYGAGQNASMDGDVNIILECMPEDFVDEVFGGANYADIKGNVSLTVTSGKFGRVFGGNNSGGNISGSITVNVSEDGCKPLIIGELYGGGKDAPYSIYGCKEGTETLTNGKKKWEPNRSATTTTPLLFNQEAKGRAAVEVNVYSCTSIGKIFGGGLGEPAEVIGNTRVWINMWQGLINGEKRVDSQNNPIIGKIGQVFGGGNAGKVTGYPTIDIGTATVYKDEITDEVCGVRILPATAGEEVYIDPISGAYIAITEAGVYGGGLSAEVDGSTTVNIGTADQNLGTIIAGNIYGGGKLGDVTGNTEVNIAAKKSGDTYTATTFAKGNLTITGDVFGAGQGKDEGDDAITSALVKGNSTINMGNGTVKGNIYGGGELASVGDTNSGGLTTINIIGGTVGDESEYVYDPNDATKALLPNTVFDSDNRVSHTNGGNVFAGGKGKYTTSVDDWTKLGNVKSTKLTVSGGTIMSNVYGGGELGAVTGSHTDTNNKVWATEISITNGTIGTEIKNGETLEYTFGSVYGGGMGDETHGGGDVNHASNANTYVSMTGGVVKASVYGGGELAQVYGSTDVQVSGGEIGHTKVGDKQFGGATMGNVYGGGKGSLTKWDAGLIKGNTKVTINPGSNGEPKIYHNIYGGGAYGSVGTIMTGSATYVPGKESVSNMPTSWVRKTGNTGVNTGTAEVYVYGGTIGVDGKENGMVFASSRGDVATPGTEDGVDPNDRLAWVYDTKLVVGGANKSPIIKGSVYGSGENGHVFTATDIEIHNGTIGVTESDALGGANYRLRGNVYGGGCGEDTFTEGTEEKFNPLAGIVLGTTSVSIDGGTVVHNVYGAGALGSVGGKTTVTISDDAVIGVNGGTGGNVFGAARGKEGITIAGSNLANVLETEVNINSHSTDNTKTGARVYGSVYGGGEAGYVKQGVVVNMNGGVVSKDVYGGGALADTQTDNWNFTSKTWAANKTSASSTTAVNLYGGQIGGDAYGGGLGRLASGTEGQTDYVSSVEAKVYGDVTVKLGKDDRSVATAFNVVKYNTEGHVGVVKSGRVFGCNNLNGSPQGGVTVKVNKTEEGNTPKTASGKLKSETASDHTYHVAAVYGGGNLAGKTVGAKTNVIINGCDVSIRQVYGGGNAARVPGTNVLVNGAYEIEQVFGGGNGKDDYTLDGGAHWTENPGADVDGYTNTLLRGGLIHEAYGGSNEKGTITGSVSINTSDDRPEGCDCELDVEKLVGAGKNADVNGDLIMILGCKPQTKTPLVFGGADNANVNGNVELTITSGTFGKVFGGNNLGGVIKGHIILNIEETGCNPIKIDELYLGGNQAAYSIYGYYNAGNEANPDIRPRTAAMYAITDPNAEGYKAPVANPAADATHSFPYAQPVLNVISCTSIGKVFGGGYGAGAAMHADPTVNINMIPGAHKTSEHQLGTIGDVFGGGNEAIVIGNTTVNIGTAETVTLTSVDDDPATTGYNEKTPFVEGARIVGDVFGGGNKANVTGNTHVNICTKEVTNSDNTTSWQKVTYGTGLAGVSIDKKADNSGGSVYGGGCSADVLGNTFVRVSGGYIFNGVFGGGYAGNVGTFDQRDKTLTTDNFDHSTHSNVCIGKPTHCAEGTGKCTVVVDGGQIGPIEVATLGMNRKDANNKYYDPVPQGWVWGGGQGLIEDPEKHPDTHFKSYVGSTDVTIGGDAFVLESIIGGGEFGRVLGSTKVTIEGKCQIGVGNGMVENGKPKRYAEDDFINPATATADEINTIAEHMPECSHFPYGRDTNTDGERDEFLPYDPYYEKYPDYVNAHKDFGPASTEKPSDGKTWIGCVFGGGSGYMPYLKKDNNGNPIGYDWCRSAGLVEGNSEVIITGGHILTNVYGANEITDVKGKSIVKMTGGTIGKPRSQSQILEHPLACNLFGAGKGDERSHFYQYTNVNSVEVEVSGGIIYGSVFGGSEDGHVIGDVKVDIKPGAVIGTWGTSYMDGNVFGGGRGFSGNILTAGNVGGNVTLNIEGGTILGSVFGGGRLGSVGTHLVSTTDTDYGKLITEEPTKHGNISINISGGTIGNKYEYVYVPDAGDDRVDTEDKLNTWKSNHKITETEYSLYGTGYRLKHTKGGNVFAGGMGRFTKLDGTVIDKWADFGKVRSTKLTISGGTIKSSVYGGGEIGKVGEVDGSTEVIVKAGTGTTLPTIGTEIQDDNITEYSFGSVFGGGYGSEIEILTDGKENEDDTPKLVAGFVTGDTKVSIEGGAVKGSVFGGGEMASVKGDTHVSVSGGSIGIDKKDITVDDNKTWLYYGGASMGNVYGGGSGLRSIVRAGRVLGNTEVTISGDSRIYHNVYGGGAYGTVGDFEYAYVYNAPGFDGIKKVSALKKLNSGGKTEVKITGGTIGIDGRENGMVFGSSRGDVDKPGERDDLLAWVNDTYVTIGDGTNRPQIMGSVYGSGENGHTFNNAVVTVNAGTIGIESTDDKYTVVSNGTRYSGADYPYRGNVYGGGCGTDTYTKNGKKYYNPLAGIVKGNTTVTINGGHVVRNVYGAGAMGSVGTLADGLLDETTHMVKDSYKNADLDNGFALSWPYKLKYEDNTGETTVKILGGKIGVAGETSDKNKNGDVYGAARGEAGDRYEMAMLGNVGTTNVTIGTQDSSDGPQINGSVYGGAENGHVNEDTDVKIYSGNIAHSVFGGGKGMGKYTANLEDLNHPGTYYPAEIYSMTAGKVYGNTSVKMFGGKVGYNVYGGGDMGSVGKGNYVGYGETQKGNLWDNTSEDSKAFLSSGVTHVTITGGEIGQATVNDGDLPMGNVFGGCRGEASPNVNLKLEQPYLIYPVFYMGYINESDVKIGESNGPTIKGSVYGGGQDGHVSRSTHVTINKGEIGTAYSDTDTYWKHRGNVYGSGSGLGKYKQETSYYRSSSSGSVIHNTMVDIEGGTIHQNVYGGGALSSVGPLKIGQEADATKDQSLCQVNVRGGTIEGDVNGASRGDLDADKELFATCLWSEVNIKPGATVKGNVFGGGEAGVLKHDAVVNVTGGTMEQDVYGGGDMADVNGNTSVYLTGGKITGAAYGGGRGRSGVAASVGGDALVDLNKDVTTKGCVVDRIFGCNNVNGSPKGHVTVHVHATQNEDKNTISEKYDDEDKHPEPFDMSAVFGGGNRADYVPTNQQDYAEVIIEGCDLTSIKEVYGGGYGAATPATTVRIRGTKLIENVFGGGYGDGNHTDSKAADYNPGANVGYRTNPKEQYGTGKATVELMAGRVNYVYGGSNSKGDIREGSSLTNVPKPDPTPAGCCDKLEVQQLYGGGKNALQEGGTEIVMGCMPDDWIEEIYAGAQNADVGGNVNLTITSGKFRRVFGGNKQGGKLQGSITVNIEENPKCDVPIIIGELYGGGNLAPYSIYGYNDDGTPKTSGKQIYRDPDVNVRAFTSIGNIFGGGYGANAVMVANPEVHIDEVEGGREYPGEQITLKDINNNESTVTLYPRLATAKMGVIGDVFGGGNAAKVIGSTHVYVATEEEVNMHVLNGQGNAVLDSEGKPTYEKKKVLGADIRGNVYGGGNNAEVTGQTNVQIGNRKVTEQSAPSAPDPEP
jgi:hypothetical protein